GLFLSARGTDYARNLRRRPPRPTRAPPSSITVRPPSGVLTTPVVVKGVAKGIASPEAARNVPVGNPLPLTLNEYAVLEEKPGLTEYTKTSKELGAVPKIV